MTLTDHRRTPAAPDDQTPANATSRAAAHVRAGWHVRVADRFLLVDSVANRPNTVVLFFADASIFTVGNRSPLWTRDPGEQIEHISALLPARDHYKPPRHMPFVTPFPAEGEDGDA